MGRIEPKKYQFEEYLKYCKVDLLEEIEEPPIAISIKEDNNKTILFSKGNFSIITGPAKSRKTYLTSILISAAIKGDFSDLFFCNNYGTNIYFDTEQSKFKTQQIAKRIHELSNMNNIDSLECYSLRILEPKDRLDFIEKILYKTDKINFVVIDGIIDLEIDPITQADQAQNIVTKLMKWTDELKIHITCVLHYNKNASTLLGHLGSFSHRKADTIIEVLKDKSNNNISIVTAIDCREKEFSPFAFSINEKGLPYILENFEIKNKNTRPNNEENNKKKKLSIEHFDNETLNKILEKAFSIEENQKYSELWHNLKTSVKIVTGIEIGDSKAKEFLSNYQLQGYIIKNKEEKSNYYKRNKLN